MDISSQNKVFLGEPIQVGYQVDPLLKKEPRCPDHFEWHGQTYYIKRVLSQWNDLARRGRKAYNMRPAHLQRAEKMGSWGVGRFTFQIETQCGRLFEIYYDRTPRKGDEGSGTWVLFCELKK